MVIGGLKFLLNNAGDVNFLKLMASGKSTKSYFSPDFPIALQLEVCTYMMIAYIMTWIEPILYVLGRW